MGHSNNYDANQASPIAGCETSSAKRTPARRRSKPRVCAIDTLDALIDHAAGLARKIFDAQGSLWPTWLWVLGNGKVQVTLPSGEMLHDRDAMAETMRREFKSRGAERYVFIIEAWTGNLTPDSVEYGASLASHPGRGEVVWLFAEDKTEARAAEMCIVRPKHGKPTLSQLKLLPAELNVSGRFVGLLE